MSELSAIKITVLVDDVARPGLLAEHGFAAWIEIAGRRLLFDTGQGAALIKNAGMLGVELDTVDALVLSHGHYDHSGGVCRVVEKAPTVDIYAHPAARGQRYSIRGGTAKAIGMPNSARAALDVHAVGVRWSTRAQQLAPGLGLTGPIPRMTGFEDSGGPFFMDSDGRERDPIPDDLALWMRSKRGLVAIVGCSHAGLANTLRHAQELSGENGLHAVLGGFHLKDATQARIDRTLDALRELGPDLIVPCHCTGETAVQMLRQTFGERVSPGWAGTVFCIGDESPEVR